MRYRYRRPLRSNAVLTLLGTFLILTASAASDALAAGTWSTTGSMTVNRAFYTATLLTDGRVLVAGGCAAFDDNGGCPTLLASAELYDPATGTWSATGSMSVGRWAHTATPLMDGRVLVAGGCDTQAFHDCFPGTRASAELYDPTTGRWSATGSMSVGRSEHTATRLLDGRVLVAGGAECTINICTVFNPSAELYNPTTGTWAPTGSPGGTLLKGCTTNGVPCRTFFGPATLLLDGRVLSTGELYDPATGTWSPTGSTTVFHNTATLLVDGRVLGTGSGGLNDPIAELYTPATGTWSPTGSTSVGTFGGLATRLQDGEVLVAGGGPTGTSAELYNPANGTWSPTGSMTVFHNTATLLADGRVLVAGGGPDGTSAELFNPSPLLAAVLPSSRSVQVGTLATAFATIINTGTSTATGCQIAPGTTLPADFAFQTTDPATNAVTGTVNTPVDIPANKGMQTFVFAFTLTAAIPATDVPLNFFCANALAAPVVSGLNTLLLSASTTPVPDIVAMSATLKNDGIVNIPGTMGTGVFAVATVNLGAGGTITVSADTGLVPLPVSIALCQTNPSTAQCVNPTVPTTSPVVTTINTNETPTFGLFVTGTSIVPFAPASSRIFVRFQDARAVPRGSTSVAVRTQ